MASRPPKVLYKYRSLSGDAFRYSQAIFTRGEVYFAKPEEFNDPSEGALKISWPDYPDYEESYGAFLRETLQRTGGIFSLTEKPDDILMWSHYADSHRGICIGFSAASPKSLFFKAEEVLYSENVPIVRYGSYRDRVEAARMACLVKAKQWSYEKEWRVIGEPGLHKVPTKLITKVILGCRIPEDLSRWVCEWIRVYAQHSEILKAKLRPDGFDVQLVPLSSKKKRAQNPYEAPGRQGADVP